MAREAKKTKSKAKSKQKRRNWRDVDIQELMILPDEVIFNAEDFGFKIDGDNLVVDQGAEGGFMEKLDKILEQNELILEYTKKIEDVIDGIDNLESFLMSKLGNDFEKIRHVWVNYKEGKIGKKGLIKEGAKIIGKKFLKIFF